MPKYVINKSMNDEKEVAATKYFHQDGLWTFVDGNNRQVYSVTANRVYTVERVDDDK